MSRDDYGPALSAALDRFTVPAPREGFAERIVAAASQPVGREARRRDRRGTWRLARRVAIGTLAAGLVSAAAVASGLLGAAGIRVPVLTAMLAPAPKPKPVIRHEPRPVQQAMVTSKPPVVTTVPEDPGLVDPGPLVPDAGTRVERVIERQAARRAFVQAHPELKPVIRKAMQDQHAFVEAHPEVRNLWKMPPAERRAFLAERPDLREAIQARRAEKRALIEANPEVAELLGVRMQQRRAERRAARQQAMSAEAAPGQQGEGNSSIAR